MGVIHYLRRVHGPAGSSVCLPRMKAGGGLACLLCRVNPAVLTPPGHLGVSGLRWLLPRPAAGKALPSDLSSVPPGDAASWSAGGPVVGGVIAPVCRGAGRCLWSRQIPVPESGAQVRWLRLC